MENLQETFVVEYNKLLAVYTEEINKCLIEETGETNVYKTIKLDKKYTQEYKQITHRKLPNNDYTVDIFTHFLIARYYTNIMNYKDKNICFFIKYHLQEVKDEYKNELHEYPENYNLSDEGIVKMIAKYKFFENLTSALFGMKELININKKSAEDYIKIFKNSSKFEYALGQVKTNSSQNNYLNYFNDNCYQLFEYLIVNYAEDGKIKYINIYYFLKELAKIKTDIYRFNIKIPLYKKMIEEKYNVLIKKFAKAEYKYDDVEKPKLIDLEKAFKNSTASKNTSFT